MDCFDVFVFGSEVLETRLGPSYMKLKPGANWLCMIDYPGLITDIVSHLPKHCLAGIRDDYEILVIKSLEKSVWKNPYVCVIQGYQWASSSYDVTLFSAGVDRLLKYFDHLNYKKEVRIHLDDKRKELHGLVPASWTIVEVAPLKVAPDACTTGFWCPDSYFQKSNSKQENSKHIKEVEHELVNHLGALLPTKTIILDPYSQAGFSMAKACKSVGIPYTAAVRKRRFTQEENIASLEAETKVQVTNVGDYIAHNCEQVLILGPTVPYSFKEKVIYQVD